jgi:hypothetical protein
MNYGEVCKALCEGKKAYRPGWNGKGMYIKRFSRSNFICILSEPEEVLDIHDGYDSLLDDTKCKDESFDHIGFLEGANFIPIGDFIYLKTVDNRAVPWAPSQVDQLAEDWIVA